MSEEFIEDSKGIRRLTNTTIQRMIEDQLDLLQHEHPERKVQTVLILDIQNGTPRLRAAAMYKPNDEWSFGGFVEKEVKGDWLVGAKLGWGF